MLSHTPAPHRSFVHASLLISAAVLAAGAGCGDDSIEDGGLGGGGGSSTSTGTPTSTTGGSPTSVTSTAVASTSVASTSTGVGGEGGAGGGTGGAGTGGGGVCEPGERRCAEDGTVEACLDDGTGFEFVETCDDGLTCAGGECLDPCAAAEIIASNAGCAFWAVDLDQQDGGGNDPASAPWGLLIGTDAPEGADIVIEINEGEPGEPADLVTVLDLHADAGAVEQVILPTRELDCGTVPNDYASPGTCLSSRAFRVTSSAPIVVTQLNTFENSYSNDASLLLPESALGRSYRVLGWRAGHPIEIDLFPDMVDRSYVTIVGTQPDTEVTFDSSWRIRGNDPIDALDAGDSVIVTLQPFDVLNLETDDGTEEDDPDTLADLSGSFVSADKPVAVFTGVESGQVPAAALEDFPTYPDWDAGTGFLDHLEEQLLPLEATGTWYVVTRSPVRSDDDFREPDVIRFVGGQVATTVTTTLPEPWTEFTLQPGEVKTTWAQDDFVASADSAFLVGQLLVGTEYTDTLIGDPSLLVLAAGEQHRASHTVLVPDGWAETWLVLATPPDVEISIDGAIPDDCIVEPAGVVAGNEWESRACPATPGLHRLVADYPFGVTGYGYGQAGSYAFNAGTGVAHLGDDADD